MGIRPENITLVEAGGVPARIIVTEPTGAETLVLMDVAGQECACLSRERINVHPGQFVQVAFRPQGMQFFDPETEKRLK